MYLQIVASDLDGDTLSYMATDLPPDLTIDASTGEISGFVSYDAVQHDDLSAVYPNVTVSVSDGKASVDVIFDWIINDVNRAPVALDDDETTDRDTPVTIDVLANNSDADNDPLTVVAILVPPLNGTVEINNDDTVTYTPNAGFVGSDNFTYLANDGIEDSNEATVTITVIGDNLPPVADAGGPYSGIVGEEVQFDGRGSYDPDGSLLSYDWDFGDGGTSTHPTPTHTYDAFGTYTVSLTVTDIDGASDTDETEALIDPQNEPPVAADDSYSTPQDTGLVIPAPGVLSNDSDADGDPLTAALDSNPANGTVSLNPDGSFTYTPNGGFFGEDAFTYVANDGQDDSNIATVTIEVIEKVEVNLPPVVDPPANTSDDEGNSVSLQIDADDPNGDPLTYSATGLPPDLDIDPSSGVISGVISFDAVSHPDLIPDSYPVEVTVSDGELSTTVSFNWEVVDVNRDPISMDDSATTPPDTPVTIDVLANDSDADGDALSVIDVGTPADGTAVNNGNGSVTYTPNAGFVGTDSFTYAIEDGFGGSSSAKVTVVVTDDGEVGDVYLTRMRTPRTLRLNIGSEKERKIAVWGDGDIKQDATVVLTATANAPDSVKVEIEPEAVTKIVRPGGRITRFPFMAEFKCKEKGRYEIFWTATIDAEQNADPTNDVAQGSTRVQCRGSKIKGNIEKKPDHHDRDHDD